MATNRPTMTVEVDFVNDPTSVTETWTNVTAYVRAAGDGVALLSTQRGRDYELARVSTGTFALIFDNTDGRFDTNNPASPYATGTGNPGSAPGLVLPGRRIRIRATWLAVTYDVFRGYVDQWPQAWTAAGFYGQANTSGTDGFAALALVDLPALVVFETLKDAPVAFYRCNDSGTSVSAGNSSTTSQPLSAIVAGSTATVSDSFAFGSDGGSGNLVGDPSSSLRLYPKSWNGTANISGYALRTADLGVGPLLALGGFSFECWFSTTNNTQNQEANLFIQSDNAASSPDQIQLSLSQPVPGTQNLLLIMQNAAASASAVVSSTVNVGDGNWHHVLCSLAADNKTPRMILDGVDQTASVIPAGVALTWSAPYLNEWGGDPRRTFKAGTGYFDGNIKNLGLYQSVVSLARAQAHFSSGAGFPGDSTGTRQGRILDAAGWPTALRTLPAGDAMQGAQSTEGVKALEAMQVVADTEAGVLFQTPDGKITQVARSARYNKTSASSLGENVSELHYLGDITVVLDSREVYNDVTVSRAGGITVRTQDSASQLRYFPRTLEMSSSANGNADAIYLAEYLLARYKDPVLRVPTLTLDPFTQPALWPIVLGYDIGTQVTVTRRPGGAASISAPFFIERVSHEVSGQGWKTTWMLSPASVSQVLQEGSSTYGHVGGGTTLNTTMTSGTPIAVLVASAVPENSYSTGDVPYDITIGTERMTVTAMGALAAGTQTATVTRGVAGTVAAAHTAAAAVSVRGYVVAF